MRIEGGARAQGAERREPGAARFGEALARARRPEPGGSRPVEARARPDAGRGRRAGAEVAAARGGGEAGACGAPGPAPAGARPPEPPVEVGPVPALARVARVLPLAVASLGTAAGAPLALSFGRSLDVELRAVAGGVEVVLRPEPALARAAEAELPRLVAALRVRGVAVVSAAVRSRGQAGGHAR
jgi:hypothetical protein